MTEEKSLEPNTLHMSMTKKEAGELLMLMNRALNVLEPIYWPSFAQGLVKRLAEFSGEDPGRYK